MPTLIELLLDPISLAVFALYGGLMQWEALAPGQPLPKVAGWKWRWLAAFGAYFCLSSYLPLVWTEWLVQYQLANLSVLGTWGGALVGLLVIEAGIYAWHRSMHASSVLWRAFHQMHHSSERLDSYSAFWFSPLDMVGWTVLSSLCLTLLVGITAEAATIVLLATTFMSIFQHSNIRTPSWLGYIVQRPESHSRHHQRGVHAGNYADLPLYDMLFGTFHNPRDFVPATGFYEGASARVADMLRFRDVSSPRPQGTDDAEPAGLRA